MLATTHEPRAMRAGQPWAVASDGITIHTSKKTPNTPTNAPATRSQRGNVSRCGNARWTSAPAPSPRVWPSVAPSTRKTRATVTRSSALVPPKGVTIFGTKCTATARPTATPIQAKTRDTKPRRHPPRPAPSAARMITRSRRFMALGRLRAPLPCGRFAVVSLLEQTRRCEESGVRHHAMVGADRLAFDVPAALQHFERFDHAERRGGQLFAQAANLQDRREVRAQNAARSHCLDRVLHDPPGLGQVEEDAVEIALIDARVGIAHLYVEGHARSEETFDIAFRTVGEVFTDLVAGDVTVRPDRPQQRGRQRARTDARLEHSRARKDVGKDQDRADVLRVDDLRAPRHLEDVLRESGSNRRQAYAARRADGHTLVAADEIVVVHNARMGVELTAC